MAPITPTASTKELKNISTYVERQQRLDILLFCVAYALIAGKTLKDTVTGQGCAALALLCVLLSPDVSQHTAF